MAAISIVTLNSWKCDGAYPARLRLMGAEAARLRPHVLLLQETFAAPGTPFDTARLLSATLGYEVAALPAREKHRRWPGGAGLCTSGQAILTAGRIKTVRSVALPADPRDGERLAQIATVEVGNARLLLVNLHLCHRDDRDDLRVAELETLCGALASLTGFDAAIMAGDFNCTPDSTPMRWLREVLGYAVRDPAAAEPFPTHGGFNDDRPPRCIDFVLQLSSPEALPRWILTDAGPALATPDGAGMYPSDHVGVMAVLTKS